MYQSFRRNGNFSTEGWEYLTGAYVYAFPTLPESTFTVRTSPAFDMVGAILKPTILAVWVRWGYAVTIETQLTACDKC